MSYLEKWDSEHGILLTLDTSKIMFPLLKDLHDFLKKYRSDEEFGLKFEMKKWEWQKRIAELESAIKNEVGIYTIKPFPDNISYNPISNYGELSSDAS